MLSSAISRHKRSTLVLTVLVVAAVFAGSSVVAGNEAPDDIEVDELMNETLAERDAAGATVAVVEDGDLAYTAGYGTADAAAGDPVIPNETTFMLGSISKLFVWSAIAQAAADGTVDLDEPIDTYLDETTFEGSDEITLTDLATHTAGYEDRHEGLFVPALDDATDWDDTLEAEMPSQVREPGETVAYSNHGTALAALVLQSATGEPFDEHIAETHFEPLGMERATFAQPAGDGHAQGHVPANDSPGTREPTTVGLPPAGSLSATAPEVATYAIALLDDGRFGDEQVLAPETIDTLRTEQTSNHSGVGGIGYGFMLTEYRGETVVWHTGTTEYFHSGFALFPEHDVAFVTSFNTPTGGHVTALDRFMDERFETPPDREPDPTTAERADQYEGTYRTIAFETTHERLASIQYTWSVTIEADGTLLLDPFAGDATEWAEVENGVFEPIDPTDEQLGMTSLAIEDDRLYFDAPLAPNEQLRWYETTTAQGALGLGAFTLILTTFAIWPISVSREDGPESLRAHLTPARAAALGAATLFVVISLGVFVTVALVPRQFVYGYSPLLEGIFRLLVPFVLLTGVTVVLVAREWASVLVAGDLDAGSMDRHGLAYLSLVSLGLGTICWLAWYWNLLTMGF